MECNVKKYSVEKTNVTHYIVILYTQAKKNSIFGTKKRRNKTYWLHWLNKNQENKAEDKPWNSKRETLLEL